MHIIPSDVVNTLSTNVPHNIEAEQALLGAILVDNRAMETASQIVSKADFYDPLHGQIFEISGTLIQSNRMASPITLKTFFENAEPISDDLTVPNYLVILAQRATTIRGAKDYAKVISDLARRRELINIAATVHASATDSPVDYSSDDLITDAESKLFELAERKQDARSVMLSDALDAALKTASSAYQRGGALAGLPTGLNDLDRMLGGLQASDLIVLAGRPSMGKTALATNIATSVAKTDNFVDFYSLEMSAEQLAMRILGDKSGISSDRLRRGDFRQSQMSVAMDWGKKLSTMPLHIDETGGITIAQLAARARRNKRRHNTKLIIVDYIQIMGGDSRQGRVQEITKITVGLKALAKELDVPIIALSQLSRAVESRDNKRPQLSDLRDSGSIEQDADVVIFVFRDEYYLAKQEPPEDDLEKHLAWKAAMDNAHGAAEIIIAKQRHGPTGTVKSAFSGKSTRFSDLVRHEVAS